jgi:hypothetical protein
MISALSNCSYSNGIWKFLLVSYGLGVAKESFISHSPSFGISPGFVVMVMIIDTSKLMPQNANMTNKTDAFYLSYYLSLSFSQ